MVFFFPFTVYSLAQNVSNPISSMEPSLLFHGSFTSQNFYRTSSIWFLLYYILSKLNCGNETETALFLQMTFKHLYSLNPHPPFSHGLIWWPMPRIIHSWGKCQIYLSLSFLACWMGIIITILQDCDGWMRMNAKVPVIVSGTWQGTQ